MTTPSFVEGNASEEYDSEDYFNCIDQAAPDSNLVESVYYDIFPDVLIDEYVPAHAAPPIEAANAIEESVDVAGAVEADATLESQIAVEESVVAEVVEAVEAVEADATLESEIAVEEEDTMSEWSEAEVEDVVSKFSEEVVVVVYVIGDDLAIQALVKSNAVSEEVTQIAREGLRIPSEAFYAALRTPSEAGTGVAIEESGEAAVEAITTMITIPAATSTSLIPLWSTPSVIEATGDSTVPTQDLEAFFGCSPMVMLQECRTTLLTAVENFFIEVEQFRIRLRRFINSVMGKWEATKID